MTNLHLKLTCVHAEDNTGEIEMVLVEDDMCYTFECPKCGRQVNLLTIVTEPTKTLLDEPFDLKAEERARKALDLIKNNPDAFNGCVEIENGSDIK